MKDSDVDFIQAVKIIYIRMKLRIFDQKELGIVQFQMLHGSEPFNNFSENDSYMESSVFSTFITCFELSKTDFEYDKLNVLDGDHIVSLRNHLLTHLTRLKAIENAEEFELFSLRNVVGIEFINALKSNYSDWSLSWEEIRDKLVIINNDLIDMIDVCIDDDKILRIKGY